MRSGIMQGIARGWGAACFLLLPVLLLGSCMTPGQVALAPASSADDFLDVIADTQSVVGGEWAVHDDPATRGCLLPDGTAGRTVSVLRIASSPLTRLNAVAATWEDLGYDVERISVGPVTQLIGINAANEKLIFRGSTLAMTLQGESACAPGE